jgi:hypothetical protein
MGFDKTWKWIIVVNRKYFDAFSDLDTAERVYKILIEDREYAESLVELVQVVKANKDIEGEDSPKKRVWW